MRTLLVVLALLVTACTGGASPAPSAGGSPSSSPGGSPASSPDATPGGSPSGPPGEAALKYLLVDRIGRPLYCDPDEYPVARGDVAALARQRLPEIRADAPTWAAIAAHLGLDPSASSTAEQALAIYTEWKMLRVLVLQPAGADRWAFDYIAAGPNATPDGASRVRGTVDARGSIAVASREPSRQPACPICLARGTRIATPGGAVAVEGLRAGDLVWTRDAAGRRVAAPIVLVGSTPVPATHRVVRLVLADGRSVPASPGHPLPDGRPVGSVRAGDLVDGARVVSAELVPYAGGATFDLLPAGPTGVYWAGGIPLRSTLGP